MGKGAQAQEGNARDEQIKFWQKSPVTHTSKGTDTPRTGSNETGPTICDGQPSILLFDLEIAETLALCTFLISVHMIVVVVAGVLVLLDIWLSFGWRVGHNVGLCSRRRVLASRTQRIGWPRQRDDWAVSRRACCVTPARVSWSSASLLQLIVFSRRV